MKIDWKKIKREYIDSDGEVILKALADKHGVKIGTLRSRKSRESWDDEINNATQRDKNVATQNKTKKINESNKKTSEETIVKEVIENSELTDKQQLFCIYYIEHFNATKAYQQAYDCSRDSARTNASRLLTNANIKSEIDRLTEECLNEKEINSKLIAKRVFQKMIDIAFADLSDYLIFGQREIQVMGAFGPLEDKEGDPVMKTVNYIDFKESTEVDGTLISEVAQGKDGIKVKLQDKMKALQWLSDRVDLLPIVVKEKLEIEKVKVYGNDDKDSLGVTIIDDIPLK